MIISPKYFVIRPSRLDVRDHQYKQKQVSIKDEVDLRPWDSLVEDQQKLGSCSANAVTSGYELMIKEQYPDKFVDLSRLFVYYNSRLFNNEIREDVGAYLRDTLKSIKKFGVCSEVLWPYDISKFTVEPTPKCYEDAKKRTITKYERLQTLGDILDALNSKKPVVIGIEIYEQFMQLNKENSVIAIPKDNDFYYGGHAVLIVGYNLKKQQFLVKNSFGTEWGDSGYFWMPFEYLEKYSFEQWIFDISDQNTILLS